MRFFFSKWVLPWKQLNRWWNNVQQQIEQIAEHLDRQLVATSPLATAYVRQLWCHRCHPPAWASICCGGGERVLRCISIEVSPNPRRCLVVISTYTETTHTHIFVHNYTVYIWIYVYTYSKLNMPMSHVCRHHPAVCHVLLSLVCWLYTDRLGSSQQRLCFLFVGTSYRHVARPLSTRPFTK